MLLTRHAAPQDSWFFLIGLSLFGHRQKSGGGGVQTKQKQPEPILVFL
jgi:hypothetical protein